MKRLAIVGCLLLLVAQAIIQVRLSSLDSPTTDEGVHLAAGYTYLTEKDFRFNPEHPPLVKILAALPLLALKPTITTEMDELYQQSGSFFHDSWQQNRTYGEKLLYASGNNPDQLIFWARMPMVLITLLLGLAVFLITYRHWGDIAALAATALYVLNPTVNAHGHLITTDTALALGFLLTVYSFWQLLRAPNWRNAVLWGLALGVALLSKHSAVIILPILVIIAFIWLLARQNTQWKKLATQSALGVLVTFLLLWAGYGFSTRGPSSIESVSFGSQQSNVAPEPVMVRLGAYYEDHLIRPLLGSVPADYAKGLFMVVNHASAGHDSFLLGEISKLGWWYYFPVLLLTKTPLPALLLIIATLYSIARYRPREPLVIALGVAAGIFFLFAMSSKANLGIRHILPIFPVLFIMIGWSVSKFRQIKLALWPLLIWSIIIFALSYPTYLGYFNELAGGSKNGYKIATDSNLDWGQDLKRIKLYLETHSDYRQPLFIEYGWLGRDSLDYYLGENSYRLLGSRQTGETGTAIIGATAFNNPEYQYLRNCPGMVKITSGTFVCQLEENL